jgi:hypothetical protein
MLPDNEVASFFLLTVGDALDLARDGEAADGYEMLIAGLRRARETEADGETWAPELVTRYQDALERFAEMYGVGRASTKGAWPFQPDAIWVSLQENDIRGTITATVLHDVKLHALSLG